MFDRNDIEEIVLSMAGIVMENRMLRKRNKELEKCVEEYHEMINQYTRDSKESNKEFLKMILEEALGVSKMEE